jgi:dipeptidyl aminopeptidase/acylaminoacyl peptidase
MKRSLEMKTVLTCSVLALAGAACIGMPAAAQERSMEIADLFELRAAGTAAVSPDGGSVAYTVSNPRNILDGEEDGPSDVELYVATGAGESRAYITGEGRMGGLAWTPDGSALTFLARREGDEATTLYEIPADGGEAQRVFAHDTSIASYVISPDGETLYFIAPPAADPDETSLRERGFRANVFEENHRFAQVWRVSLQDEDAEATAFDLPGHPSSLVISDNGRRLAVALAPTPLVDDSLMERRWHVIEADDGEIVSVFDTEAKIGQAAFSPNGRRLAFIAGVDRSDPTAGTLHVGFVRTGEFEPVARDAEQHVGDLAWINNDEILTLAQTGVESALVRYDVDGTEVSRGLFQDYVVRGFDYDSQTGRLALTADAPTHPREVFVGQLGDVPQRWTELNPQLSEIAFGPQSIVEYEARDGEMIQGVLITPRGEAPDGGWPLIMTVHGGPEAHDSDGWLTSYSDLGQIAAGDGFAVFYPNYRGSTGRGERFAKLDHLDAPGEEFWDIVDAIGALAEQGVVDPDRVGITGGSYGGFASAWGATIASEHFAASAPFVALTDLVSFWGTTEIPIEMVDVHFMQYPWENWDFYSRYSPTWNAQGSTTATLILHGEADMRVDPRQSYTLYRFLKMAGEAPVRLVTYPGEGHGNRQAAAQFDYAHRVLRWMDHYLQGPGGEPPAADLPMDELLGDE